MKLTTYAVHWIASFQCYTMYHRYLRKFLIKLWQLFDNFEQLFGSASQNFATVKGRDVELYNSPFTVVKIAQFGNNINIHPQTIDLSRRLCRISYRVCGVYSPEPHSDVYHVVPENIHTSPKYGSSVQTFPPPGISSFPSYTLTILNFQWPS